MKKIGSLVVMGLIAVGGAWGGCEYVDDSTAGGAAVTTGDGSASGPGQVSALDPGTVEGGSDPSVLPDDSTGGQTGGGGGLDIQTPACTDAEYSDRPERIAVIESANGGETWTWIGLACFHAPFLTPVDPAPRWENGEVVLYFFDISSLDGADGGGPPYVMYRSSSADGVDFSYPTVAWSVADATITDPMVVQLPSGTYRMYVSAGTMVLSASSTDGEIFQRDDGERSVIGGVPGALILPDGRVRLFVCGAEGIISLISDDGLEFAAEDGVRIALPEDGGTVCDPHPIALASGGYMMTYKVRPAGEASPNHDLVYLATSEDGLAWTVGDAAVAIGSVPGLVELGNGVLRIYYVDFTGGTGESLLLTEGEGAGA